MNVIRQYLQEYHPKHPDTVLIKNKFYPTGITEQQVYEYYMEVKDKLLDWIGTRYASFFLRMENGSMIVLRRKNENYFKLTKNNYEEVITGRTNIVLVQHPGITNYFIVDIDPGKDLGRTEALEASNFAYENLRKEFDVKQWEMLTTSERGIHVIGYMSEQFNINILRTKVKDILTKNITKEKYIVDIKGRPSGYVNFDLTAMFKNRIHIAKHSLTKDFLICTDSKKGLVKI